jgi:hypothetical protein
MAEPDHRLRRVSVRRLVSRRTAHRISLRASRWWVAGNALAVEAQMKKEWLWGPGRIDPDYRGLAKRAYLERLASVRESYLAKLLRNLDSDDIQYICRMEKARFSLLMEFDQVSEDEFKRANEDVPACRDCPNMTECEADSVCGGWSLADFAAHMLTHEEKNVDPEVNETVQHMAEHEETHLHQVQSIVGRLRRNQETMQAATKSAR